MTSQTALPKSVILFQCKCSDREVFRTRAVGLGTERPLFQAVRRRLDDTGAVEEVVLSECMREGLPRLLENGVCRTEWQVACVTEALRLMDEAAQAREAEEAEALQSEGLSAPPCEDGTEPSGPSPAQPVTAGAADTPEELRAVLLRQQKEEEKERRERSRWFVAKAGQRIRSSRPPELLPGDWFHMVLEELGWEGWWEAYDDPRIQRGDWDRVREALERAKARAAAQDPHLFGISGEVEIAGNYPTSTPKPTVGSFEHMFAIRCPVEVPEDEWRQRILERLPYADWGAVRDAAEGWPRGWADVRGGLSGVQDDLFMEMQHIEIRH